MNTKNPVNELFAASLYRRFDERYASFLFSLQSGVSFGKSVRDTFGIKQSKYVRLAINYFPTPVSPVKFLGDSIKRVIRVIDGLKIGIKKNFVSGLCFFVVLVDGKYRVREGTVLLADKNHQRNFTSSTEMILDLIRLMCLDIRVEDYYRLSGLIGGSVTYLHGFTMNSVVGYGEWPNNRTNLVFGGDFRVREFECVTKILKRNFKYRGIYQLFIRLNCKSIDVDNGEVGFTYYRNGEDPQEMSVIFSQRSIHKVWMIDAGLGSDESFLLFHHNPFRGSFKYTITRIEAFSDVPETEVVEYLECDHSPPSIELMNRVESVHFEPSYSWLYYNVLQKNGFIGPRPYEAHMSPRQNVLYFSGLCESCEGCYKPGRFKCISCMEFWTYTCMLKCGHVICQTCMDQRVRLCKKYACPWCKMPFMGYSDFDFKIPPMEMEVPIHMVKTVPIKRIRRMYRQARDSVVAMRYMAANMTQQEVELMISRYSGEKL